jgi:hypothetical protein
MWNIDAAILLLNAVYCMLEGPLVIVCEDHHHKSIVSGCTQQG